MSKLKQRKKLFVGEASQVLSTKECPKYNNGNKTTDYNVLLSLILFRIINIFLVRTSFVPDEYWQSLEVAHKSVFGYGYLTWEWKYGLRSYIYPALFSSSYHLLDFFDFDNAASLIYIPRLMQGIMSAVGDWYLYRFTKIHFGNSIANYTILCNSLNWFWFYCSTRTIINTLVTNLTCVGFYYFPWHNCENHTSSHKVFVYQVIAILISVIRPTAAVIWIPLALWHMLIKDRRFSVFMSYVLLSVGILTISTLTDRLYYGKWVFVHWNFFTFNVLKDMGVHYGTHPWHWYLMQGVPAILTTELIFFGAGVVSVLKKYFNGKNITNTEHNFDKLSTKNLEICKCLLALFCFTVLVYSCIGHKEFRFVLHLIPIASIFAGFCLSTLSPKLRKLSLLFLLLTNLPVAIYTGLIHQSGALSITEKLRFSLIEKCNPNCPSSVLYLMPCHSTPLYSHLHVNVSTRFLECPPNLSSKENYLDEADRFYLNPTKWLNENIFTGKDYENEPFWILMFDSLYDDLSAYKPITGYEICATSFHTHVPESRTGRNIHLVCKKQNSSLSV